ncbi:MAG: DUF3300 domain-containing protein [Phycisphaerales bacterium]|nr:MAG: DUF3300 domain-containing protein [Phycisphaerales bacterium]
MALDPQKSRGLTGRTGAAVLMAALLSATPVGYAQQDGVAGAPVAEPEVVFTDEELEDLVGPIALYPDALIAQILPASAYPLEVVQAWRDLEQMGGTADEETIKGLDYDPAVLALMHYPEVLKMMNEDLDWTMALGDAVVADQEAVMSAIQRFRALVKDAGNLETNEQITIIEERIEEREIIRIVPSNPEVIYVPYYSPSTVVVRYEYRTDPLITFTSGLVVGAWLGYGCDWRYGRCNVDVKYRNYWVGVRPGWGAHPYWRPHAAHRAAYRHGARAGARAGWHAGRRSGARPSQLPSGPAAGRPGGRPGDRPGAGQRPGAGRPGDRPGRPGIGDRPGGGRPGDRPGRPGDRPGVGGRPSQLPAGGQRPGAGDRPGGGRRPGDRPASGVGDRPSQRPAQGAYGGNRSGNAARNHSQRGASSRSGGTGRSPSATHRSAQPSRSAYGGNRSGSSARSHSARGAQSRGAARGGGGGRGGGRRR